MAEARPLTALLPDPLINGALKTDDVLRRGTNRVLYRTNEAVSTDRPAPSVPRELATGARS